MALTFSNIIINSFNETQFIAGSYKELNFYAFTSASSAIDLRYITGLWSLSPYEQPNYSVLDKTAIGYNGYFLVKLLSTDTKNLRGKYIQRIHTSGLTGFEYALGQGIINIIPAIEGG